MSLENILENTLQRFFTNDISLNTMREWVTSIVEDVDDDRQRPLVEVRRGRVETVHGDAR